jgi:hypothetical protein
VEFERVQEAGIGTGSGSLTVTSVGLNTTGNNVRATTGSNFSSF